MFNFEIVSKKTKKGRNSVLLLTLFPVLIIIAKSYILIYLYYHLTIHKFSEIKK